MSSECVYLMIWLDGCQAECVYSRMDVYVMIAVWCVELCVAYLFYVNSVSRCVAFLLCIN